MKRPVALIGFTYLTGLLVSSFCSAFLSLLLCVLLLPLGIGALFLKKLRPAPVIALSCVTLSAAFGAYAAAQSFYAAPLEALHGMHTEIRGEVRKVEYSNASQILLVRVDHCSLEDAPQHFNLQLILSEPDWYQPGDRIQGEVQLLSMASGSLPTRYRSARAKDLFLYAMPQTPPQVTDDTSLSLAANLQRSADALSSALRRRMPEEPGALACAMTLGDRQWLAEETVGAFRTTGASHLLALSGLHLSILCALPRGLFRRFAISPKICYTITIFLVLLYMALTGFPFSLQRAGIMQILSCVALLCFRKADPITSLGFSAGFICLLQPYAAADPGLLLSVATTASILVFADRWTEKAHAWLSRRKGFLSLSVPNRFCRWLAGVTAVSLAAALAAYPLSAVIFGSVSLLAPLTTLLCMPLVPVVMIGGLLAALFQLLGAATLAVFPGLFAQWAAAAMLGVTDFLSRLPFVSVFLQENYVVLFAFLALLGALLFRRLFGRIPLRFAGCCLLLLLSASLFHQLMLKDTVSLQLVQRKDTAGLVLSRNGEALYFGTLENSSHLYDLALSLHQDRLFGLCLTQPPKESAKSRMAQLLKQQQPAFLLAPEAPDAVPLPSLYDPALPLQPGRLDFSEDTLLEILPAGPACALELCYPNMTVLLLPEGANADLLPAASTKPDLLITFGPAEQLSLLRPHSALVLGQEQRTARRTQLLSNGAVLLDDRGPEEVLLHCRFRYGDDPMVAITSLTSP